MAQITVGPHTFQPISRVLHRKKCRACYMSKELHPTHSWFKARPLGDKK